MTMMNTSTQHTPATSVRRLAVLVGLGIVVFAAACDRAQLVAPTASTISISASSRVLGLGESTEIGALVIEDAGTPVHNGTTVRFTSSLGQVEPAQAQTHNGLATAMFRAGGVSGIAEIRATSGGAVGDAGSNVLEITVGAVAASAVTLTAMPSTVPATGGTVTLVASVVDASGNRLQGIPVTFSTTAGSLSASSAVTNAGGDATAQLTTDRTATVTARVAGLTATASVTVATPPGVTLSVSPAMPIVDVPMVLTVTVTVATGNPVPTLSVDWGDGGTDDLGLVATTRGISHTYGEIGSYVITVTATADGVTTSTATAVTVIVAP